jgi:hypothetical protein
MKVTGPVGTVYWGNKRPGHRQLVDPGRRRVDADFALVATAR